MKTNITAIHTTSGILFAAPAGVYEYTIGLCFDEEGEPFFEEECCDAYNVIGMGIVGIDNGVVITTGNLYCGEEKNILRKRGHHANSSNKAAYRNRRAASSVEELPF